MSSTHTALPCLDVLKDQAKRLRASLLARGRDLSHFHALEAIAAQYGFRDWNTLHAAVGNRPPLDPYALGSRVKGHYLGQAFEARILGVHAIAGRFRLTLDLDEPVDVVTFDSFSSFRKRVSCTVDETGRTAAKTSNGRPHVELMW
jgi:hypothetical protein